MKTKIKNIGATLVKIEDNLKNKKVADEGLDLVWATPNLIKDNIPMDLVNHLPMENVDADYSQ